MFLVTFIILQIVLFVDRKCKNSFFFESSNNYIEKKEIKHIKFVPIIEEIKDQVSLITTGTWNILLTF